MAHTIKALLSHYDAAFTGKFGVRYPLNPGKDATLAKGLLALYSLEQLTGWIDQFFESDDEWIAQSGYSFGVFRSCLSKVITARTTNPRIEKKAIVWTRHNMPRTDWGRR